MFPIIFHADFCQKFRFVTIHEKTTLRIFKIYSRRSLQLFQFHADFWDITVSPIKFQILLSFTTLLSLLFSLVSSGNFHSVFLIPSPAPSTCETVLALGLLKLTFCRSLLEWQPSWQFMFVNYLQKVLGCFGFAFVFLNIFILPLW